MTKVKVTKGYQVTIPNPSKYLWNISKKPSKIDVVGLVKGSRKEGKFL